MRLSRKHIVFVHDLVMAALALPVALYLRLDFAVFDRFAPHDLLFMAGVFTAIAAVAFRTQKMYAGIWRYASVNDLLAIVRGVTLLIAAFTLGLFLYNRLEGFPRSTPFIAWGVLMVLLGGPRFAYRMLKDRRITLHADAAQNARVPVLLIGAGDAADLFIRAMETNPQANYRVVAILGETSARVGRRIRGVEVMGTLDDLAPVVETLTAKGRRPQRVILTKDTFDGEVVARMAEETQALGLGLSRLPRLDDLRTALADQAFDLKPVAIEDLLQRPQTVLDRDRMAAFIRGRRVLVTGAGGSIGSELVRQVAGFGPAEMTLVEASEFALYTIDMELFRTRPEMPRAALIGDVRDRARLDAIFTERRPELVFHAAALKHVPLVEANPLEGLITNAAGSRNVAEACVAHGVSTMVMVSTDKAVNPTNVMGASKRMAECLCQAMDLAPETRGTRFVTVRFGNVLGSTGSVVPLFEKQLREGGPITVTHPEMRRYFMTIREAVELVIEAGAMGAAPDAAAGHEGKIYVLEMGQPVKIVDLARQMIRLAGLRPEVDVPIVYTGLRPGEKLFEEIFHGEEQLLPTATKGVLLAAPRPVELADIRALLDKMEAACRAGDLDAALAVMRRVVPEYQGSETGPH
ncbi:nucleoside-diphosphate sugar epimerase/dehydratase [Oleispirillum naphthae]|uniref:polysaccharide biosynthesis protein n=1 Tax=Oleispirillum naphthae TaxID=2838853 RepID=UPI0030825D33